MNETEPQTQSKPPSMAKQILSGCVYTTIAHLLEGDGLDQKTLASLSEKLCYAYSLVE